ncbi:hypothetical protein ACQ4PT_000540 [Festuca glaucescens]
MDVLDAMFRAAEHAGVLASLRTVGLRHRVSLFADDVVVFAKPGEQDLRAVRAILACFGDASGLVVNFAKSSAAPIRCDADTRDVIAPLLACQVKDLPHQYLGLLLSLRKPSRTDLQPVLDKLANKLAFWKARLMTRDGRVGYVKAVMAASVNAVCAPKHLGGLGFPNLRWMHAALRARWIWLQRTDSSRPWVGLRFAVTPDAATLFNASVAIHVGSSAALLFWTDPWLSGLSVAAVAPVVLRLVRPGVAMKRSVRDGVQNHAWVLDIVGELTVDAVVQFLRLWNAVQAVPLSDRDDKFMWKWTADGVFTIRSAYQVFFHGTTALPGAVNVWNSFAPYKFSELIMINVHAVVTFAV